MTLLTTLSTAPLCVNATSYYVSGALGNNSATGLSTSTPVKTLAKGISLASAAGDVVKVMPGTYTEPPHVITFGPITIESTDGADTTIINCIPYIPAAAFTIQTSGVTLRKLSIVGCKGGGAAGGAVLVVSSYNALLHGMKFTDNQAETGGAVAALGGSIHIADSVFDGNSCPSGFGGSFYAMMTNATVTNSQFLNGKASNGGALAFQFSTGHIESNYIYKNTAAYSGGGIWSRNNKISLVGNLLRENTASVYGGGAYMHSSDVTVRGDQYTSNDGGIHGGGLFIEDSRTPSFLHTVKQCTFTTNKADDRGGGVFIWRNTYVTIDFCTFDGNTAHQGGGINIYHCLDAKVRNSTFTRNTITGDGGGTYARCENKNVLIEDNAYDRNVASRGAGLYVCKLTTVYAYSNNFTSNTAVKGGALYFSGSMKAVYASYLTMIGNTATLRGGGFTGDSLHFIIEKSVMKDNTAPLGGALYLAEETGAEGKIKTLTLSNNAGTDAGAHAEIYLENAGTKSVAAACESCTFLTASTVPSRIASHPSTLEITQGLPSDGLIKSLHPYDFKFLIRDAFGTVIPASSLGAKVTVTVTYWKSLPSDTRGAETKPLIVEGAELDCFDDTTQSSVFTMVGRMNALYNITLTASVSRGTIAPVTQTVTIFQCEHKPQDGTIREFYPPGTHYYQVCGTRAKSVFSSYAIVFGVLLLAVAAIDFARTNVKSCKNASA
jgi:hypothetical protein